MDSDDYQSKRSYMGGSSSGEEEDIFEAFFGKRLPRSKSSSSSSVDLAAELAKKNFHVYNSEDEDDVFRNPSTSSTATKLQACLKSQKKTEKSSDAGGDHSPETSTIISKEVLEDPNMTWDFSLQSSVSNYKSKCQQIEGTVYQKLGGECLHEMVNVVCPCNQKNKIALCRKCHQVFCSTQCFRRSTKLNTGVVNEDKDAAVELRPAEESQPKVKENSGNGVEAIEKTTSDLKLNKDRSKGESSGSKADKKIPTDKCQISTQNVDSSTDKLNQHQEQNIGDEGRPCHPRNSDSRRIPLQKIPGGIPPPNLWSTQVQVQMNGAFKFETVLRNSISPSRLREPHPSVGGVLRSIPHPPRCTGLENQDSKPRRVYEEPVKILRDPGPPPYTAIN